MRLKRNVTFYEYVKKDFAQYFLYDKWNPDIQSWNTDYKLVNSDRRAHIKLKEFFYA